MAEGSDQLHIRLPPDIIARINADVEAGKAKNKTDWIYRAALEYIMRSDAATHATQEFNRMFYSNEFKDYIQKIVAKENERKERRSDER